MKNPPIAPFPPELATKIRFGLFFDRANPMKESSMDPFVEGVHTYATKQVPTCLALASSGSPTLAKRLKTVLSEGMTVIASHKSEVDLVKVYIGNSGNNSIAVVDQKIYEDSTSTILEDESHHESCWLFDEDGKYDKNFSYRLSYEDPFRIVAGRVLARELGLKAPTTLVWPGDGFRITDQIPPNLLKKTCWDGSTKNKIRFWEIKGVHIKMDFLMKCTFWGRALASMCGDPKHGPLVHKWARLLYKRINFLLQGREDPMWSPQELSEVYGEKYTHRNLDHRAKRLIEVLKTVDGIFLQRYTAVPEESWTWEKFDIFTLKNLASLIGDEFFDGEIMVEYHDLTTRYDELKRARKTFKDLSNREVLDDILKSREAKSLVPRWLNQWLPIWKYTRSFKKPFALLHVDGVLGQTRSAGQPPDLVKMKSKRKMLETVSEEPDPLTPMERKFLRTAIKTFDLNVDDSIFTGLDTKARITVNANACWENTREDGGTLEAISDIVVLASVGKSVPVRDLHTGRITEELLLKDTTEGTYIFWACLDVVLKSDPEDIRKAALVMVSEPGKARTVTKSSAALKIVLDVISKICSWPLHKIESSASGMGMSSHAWQAFKSSFTEEGKEYAFDCSEKRTEKRPGGDVIVTSVYQDLYQSSTDFETATDALQHEIARTIARYWMDKCGIPPILQMIVNGTSYAPRYIIFEAGGPMSHYGEEWTGDSPFRNPRFVMLRKGVLMGDPLTKPVLHLVNILVRIGAANFADHDFIRRMFPKEFDKVVEKIEFLTHPWTYGPLKEGDMDSSLTEVLSAYLEEAVSTGAPLFSTEEEEALPSDPEDSVPHGIPSMEGGSYSNQTVGNLNPLGFTFDFLNPGTQMEGVQHIPQGGELSAEHAAALRAFFARTVASATRSVNLQEAERLRPSVRAERRKPRAQQPPKRHAKTRFVYGNQVLDRPTNDSEESRRQLAIRQALRRSVSKMLGKP